MLFKWETCNIFSTGGRRVLALASALRVIRSILRDIRDGAENISRRYLKGGRRSISPEFRGTPIEPYIGYDLRILTHMPAPEGNLNSRYRQPRRFGRFFRRPFTFTMLLPQFSISTSPTGTRNTFKIRPRVPFKPIRMRTYCFLKPEIPKL